MRDADDTTAGGAMFVGGSMRRLVVGSDGNAFLSDGVSRSQPLARIKATGAGIPVSRSIVWALARQVGDDPTRWRLNGAKLVTWGGEPFNTLIAALLTREIPGKRFTSSIVSVSGPLSGVEISVGAMRQWATRAEEANDLPLSLAGKFTNPSRFIGKLSSRLTAEEKRRSIPWNAFHRWLKRVSEIDEGGS